MRIAEGDFTVGRSRNGNFGIDGFRGGGSEGKLGYATVDAIGRK